ncbi:MAG: hypothetical protein LLG13_18665 [Bacteroidales bacterium]|nr:hypothetical protein [Bacteroidales bacterium]
MKKELILLTDYKGFFGFKQLNPIYRGGMDLSKLINSFRKRGYNAKAMNITDITGMHLPDRNSIVLYTSSEDKEGLYKSLIEDVIYHLEINGVSVVPSFAYLRAHNNKVAMELLRKRVDFKEIQTINSKIFGTIEELKKSLNQFTFPVVIKASSGAMSKGVARAENPDELIREAKKISSSKSFWHTLKEYLRSFKYNNRYVKESFYRRKFLVQNLIPDLCNDWKVLVYGSYCYVLYRGNRNNDFRASGSGKFEFRKEIPEGMLDFAVRIEKLFKVPNISLDIGFDGKEFHVFEFQFINFGTTTIEKAPFFFKNESKKWIIVDQKSDLEETYVNSIVSYLEENGNG